MKYCPMADGLAACMEVSRHIVYHCYHGNA